MKMILTAVALAIASPAIAQAAPQADPHAGHVGHSAHQAGSGEHSGHKPDTGHKDHKGCCDKSPDGRMECCEKMAAEGKRMACCEKHGKSAPAADPHAGHHRPN